jgi:hypothetical protein
MMECMSFIIEDTALGPSFTNTRFHIIVRRLNPAVWKHLS